MNSPLRIAGVLCLFLLLASCSPPIPKSPPVAGAEVERMSMVFGYIDMADAPSNLTQVQMKRMRPLDDKPYYGFGVKDGLFYRIDVPRGAYKFTKITGVKWNTVYNYKLEAQGKGDLDQNVQKPDLYFAGAWNYKPHKKGWFQQDEFELTPASSPSEREVLERILAVPGIWDKPYDLPGANGSKGELRS